MTDRELEQWITVLIDEECDKLDALHEIGTENTRDAHIIVGRVSMAAEIRRKIREERKND